jgi:7-cyano-7-deazaguanine synthase
MPSTPPTLSALSPVAQSLRAERRAVILVSGGMDSAVTLALAKEAGFVAYALSIDYQQRHRAELDAARANAITLGATAHKVVPVDLRTLGGSALTQDDIAVPTQASEGIPSTYVPARNTIMLSIALGWAEVLGANDIFTGVNAVDFSGYPDCRPAFVTAFQGLANVATKAGVEGAGLRIHAPLIAMSKADIVREGLRLGIDFSATVSCYQADSAGRACRLCDACRLRAAGFDGAGIADPTRYV